MEGNALDNLLELVNNALPDNQLYIGRIDGDTFTLLRILDQGDTNLKAYENKPIALSETYCHQVFITKAPVMIKNTAANRKTKSLPFTKQLAFRSYAGVPIYYQDGSLFGSLCAINLKPGQFDHHTMEVLEKFSRLFAHLMELEKQAKQDMLTKTYNRRYLHEYFEKASIKGTLLSIDLDGFKEVNDCYGHAAGDEILIEVTRRLEQNLREQDRLFRLGGDEFIIILPGSPNESFSRTCAQAIIASLSEWSDFSPAIDISVSIGIVHYQNKQSLKKLLQIADEGLYQAKQQGKGKFTMMPSG
ncbi:sensor domain-containing diguanylate cyclase [Gracilibacillus timonensis]|uniref:sensor domain-containing diguanylate cyclase n=1 Tax=Gracilibacillus timonensis TaxID=1816696 RepID=UPI000825E577|nr:sensor domain-containing diguanylate cyclase [Gracilibacillus timonensis]